MSRYVPNPKADNEEYLRSSKDLQNAGAHYKALRKYAVLVAEADAELLEALRIIEAS